MSIEQMREALIDVYPGERWVKKVSKWSDKQVFAVYNKFVQSNKIR